MEIMLLFIIFLIIYMSWKLRFKKKSRDYRENKLVHMSIDDVWYSLNELTKNQEKYESIFKVKFFKKLKNYNEKYGAKFTLYIYEKNVKNSYNIANITIKFREEFKKNSSWLKFGYHGIDENDNLNNVSLKEFKNSFNNVQDAIKRFSSDENLSGTLRLHYFSGKEDQLHYLYKNGVKILLCSDDKRINYDLNKKQNIKLQKKGKVIQNKINYYKTDIRLDNIKWWNINKKLNEIADKNEIVMFVHEWALHRKYYKLNQSLKWLCKNNYFFK